MRLRVCMLLMTALVGMTTVNAQTLRGSNGQQIGRVDSDGTIRDANGRSIGKARVADHVPLNTPTTTTVLSSIRTDGSHIAVTYQGGTTGERFVSCLKEHLLIALKPGDVVVMDNLRSHHVREVEEAFAGTGVKYCYLPPYSPDLNPIEKMWSKMKSILRHWKVRETQKLPEAIYAALNLVTESDCLHWFHFCGCC